MTHPETSPKAHLPLSPAVLAILLALSSGEKHGYAIMKDAAQPAGGHLTLGPGTLYGTLDRLVRDALVEETGFTDDTRRRYYRLTSLGLKIFSAEIARLRSVLHAAQNRALPRGVRA